MSEIRHIPFSTELREPLVTARTTIVRRAGFILALEHEGRQFVSETTLMPEFGTEHFEHAERILNGESLMLPSAPASVYGLDCLRHAIEKKDDRELRVPIAKLLPGGSNEKVIAAARQAMLEHYDTVKLKVGYRKVEEDISLVNTLALELPELILRLDANLGWSADDVRSFAAALPRESVEWIEDPCRLSIQEWADLQQQVRIPFACDEAFRESEILEHRGSLGFRALILKPGRMGAINEHEELRKRMRDEDVTIVLSSMFDSSIGLSYLGHLADEWSTLEIAHGLGTLHFLKRDTLEQPLTVEAGHLVVPPLAELAGRVSPDLAQKLGLRR